MSKKQEFMKNVCKTEIEGKEHCWLWQGQFNQFGYGMYQNGFAHRISYLLHKGRIPKKWVIDHKCRIRSCVNPNHLDCMPQSENIKRKGINHLNENDYLEEINDPFKTFKVLLSERFANIVQTSIEQTLSDLAKISLEHPNLMLHFPLLIKYWDDCIDGYKIKHVWYFMYSVNELGYSVEDIIE